MVNKPMKKYLPSLTIRDAIKTSINITIMLIRMTNIKNQMLSQYVAQAELPYIAGGNVNW